MVDRYSADNQWSGYRPSVSHYIDRDICRYSWSICWPSLGRYLGWYISQYVDRHISTDTRPICRPKYQLTLGQYVDRYIKCWSICRLRCRPIYRLRGAQNTHDPTNSTDSLCRSRGENNILSRIIILKMHSVQSNPANKEAGNATF